MSQLNAPTVSIITPSYNAERLIGRTLQSVLDQSWQDWELLVIDDCSKDDTRDVVARYASMDSRIRLIALDKNNGAPAAPRNIGIREARGQWIAFLDADDIWHPEKLALQMSAAREKSGEFLSTQMLDFVDDTQLTFSPVGRAPVGEVTFAQQRLKGRIPTSSVLVTKDLMLKFPFNEDIRYKAVEDYHCWLRILRSGVSHWKVQYPLLSYRRIVGQISGSKKYMLERMHMVHREFPQTSELQAAFYTLSHAAGGFYYRILRKGL
ncbi:MULTISPECIES: glycosyltransferase family 2 protein [Pseudomonas]|uniref:Glycosyltransferase family 2 protein n=1 Tax=Pseudomonas taiwanensis TaxID=470150 RepID=A0ABR6V889_9PSED|nr:glycosyltransferase family 2 protein [Pseudomonas sp. SWI44]AVD86522.1 glycosyltransferase family 2 protein [Pseudomonas sp. SWI44]MBC3476318.1 glycosyltransferase family 2 protein [Pseudomonas taiwanensis]MBC3493992.1 glycosyltransferase family 2 protein [Pseudomonas taiwanensis]